MRPDYKNWVPRSMVIALYAGALLSFLLFLLTLQLNGNKTLGTLLLILSLVLLFYAVWMDVLHRTFDYRGKRKMAKTIIEGTASYVTLPEGGVGLDIGCGSGALTIACAKHNPKARMVGCDIWSGAYKAVFTRQLCEENAKAEGVDNVSFEEGNAVLLPFEDESFDAVTSNYVYHNISLQNKQKLLEETLRVLKKGGTFAIHDLMSKARYGDMEAFVRKLKEKGYEEVRLIDTTDGMFMNKKEALLLGLSGSALLVGRK